MSQLRLTAEQLDTLVQTSQEEKRVMLDKLQAKPALAKFFLDVVRCTADITKVAEDAFIICTASFDLIEELYGDPKVLPREAAEQVHSTWVDENDMYEDEEDGWP